VCNVTPSVIRRWLFFGADTQATVDSDATSRGP
jgi:hypothetical protein